MNLNTFKRSKTFFFLCLFFLFCQFSMHADTLYLRENLKKAKIGDFVVTMQNKTFTMFHINKIDGNSLFIEEISIPSTKFAKENCTFRAWFEGGAPKNSSWIMYKIDLSTGQMLKSYVHLQNGWVEKPINQSFLSTLLNLRLNAVSPSERKKIGRVPHNRNGDKGFLWQPQLKLEGQVVKDIPFNAWYAKWPNDKSDLSGKSIEIYTPEDSDFYPSYLPYWLEISGMIGSAKIRIVDSGRNLTSPHPF